VRLVLRTRPVAQDLQPFAVLDRPIEQRRDARLDAAAQRLLATGEEHALAGARVIDLARSGVCLHRLGPHQPRARQRDHFVALLVREQPAEHDPLVARSGSPAP